MNGKWIGLKFNRPKTEDLTATKFILWHTEHGVSTEIERERTFLQYFTINWFLPYRFKLCMTSL